MTNAIQILNDSVGVIQDTLGIIVAASLFFMAIKLAKQIGTKGYDT